MNKPSLAQVLSRYFRSAASWLGVWIALAAGGPAVGATFGEWLVEQQVPATSDGLTDRNGSLRLTNLEAYAYGLNPYAALPADLPRVLRIDPASGMHMAYRRDVAAAGVEWTLLGSSNARDWAPLTPLADQVQWTVGTVEGRELVVPLTGGLPFFIRFEIGMATYDNPNMVRITGGSLPALSSLGELAVADFLIGRYEVTVEEWVQVRDWAVANGYDLQGIGVGCAASHPVQTVNWYDVVKWCNARSEMLGLTPVYSVNGAVYRADEFGATGSEIVVWDPLADGYRLPTEAEWEFAARGGLQTNNYIYSGGDDLNAVGWSRENSAAAECALDNGVAGPTADLAGTWPVGQKAANELGLYDMSGNVWEWCWDPRTTSSPAGSRWIRGGSWLFMEGSARLNARNAYRPIDRYYYAGFRLARN
jgi:formylglycine-generating enzyme